MLQVSPSQKNCSLTPNTAAVLTTPSYTPHTVVDEVACLELCRGRPECAIFNFDATSLLCTMSSTVLWASEQNNFAPVKAEPFSFSGTCGGWTVKMLFSFSSHCTDVDTPAGVKCNNFYRSIYEDAPAERHKHVAVRHGGDLVLVGGKTFSGTPLQSMVLFNTRTTEHTPLGDAPTGQYNTGVVVKGSLLVMFENSQTVGQKAVFSLITREWIPAMPLFSMGLPVEARVKAVQYIDATQTILVFYQYQLNPYRTVTFLLGFNVAHPDPVQWEPMEYDVPIFTFIAQAWPISAYRFLCVDSDWKFKIITVDPTDHSEFTVSIPSMQGIAPPWSPCDDGPGCSPGYAPPLSFGTSHLLELGGVFVVLPSILDSLQSNSRVYTLTPDLDFTSFAWGVLQESLIDLKKQNHDPLPTNGFSVTAIGSRVVLYGVSEEYPWLEMYLGMGNVAVTPAVTPSEPDQVLAARGKLH